jgi:hypothetical protein
MKGSILLGFLVVVLQISVAQDFDFQQGDDVDNLVVMEAENFSSNTPNGTAQWSLTDEPADFSGEGAMMAVSDNPFASKEDALAGSAVLSYKINFVASGIHYIWAHACRMVGPSDDSYHAGINGTIEDNGVMLTFHGTTFDNGTWGWINFRNNVEPGNVYVPSEGVHELNIYIRENGFRIDKIILTPSDTNDFKPEGLGPDETLPPSSVRIATSNFDENLFTLYSNMVSEELTVIFDEKELLQGTLEIISPQGSVIKSVMIDNHSQLNMNISGLRSGMYFVKVQTTDKSVLVKKFVKR